jgi:hypothetical protein
MNLRKHLSNIPGWRTSRKIVVLESDDWGSIRTRSKKDYNQMLARGLQVDRSHFTKYDGLESNTDLTNLFELLSKHKDSTNRPAVFTPMCIPANPNFKKIKEHNFKNYFYEPLNKTCEQYPNHDNVIRLWREGISKRLFVPGLHGREHLNSNRWMQLLQSANEGAHLAFEHQSVGASWYKNRRLSEYLAAFNPISREDILVYDEIIETGAKMFKDICNYLPEYFIASNSSEPKSLETILKKVGVNYLTRYKIQNYPLGNGKFKREFNWLGKTNKFDQIILTRNCGFEPSDPSINDWVKSCLTEIEIAFKWNKPAIISTHRVNYIGHIDESNAKVGLKQLDELLSKILQTWPQIEFMTSMELGRLIKRQKSS